MELRAPTKNATMPRLLFYLISLFLVYHLGSVILNVLAAPSGPWPSMEGPEMAMPPHIAAYLHQKLSLGYLQSIKLSHNYHFRTNRVGQPEAALEFRLENDDGETLKTIRYPDPKSFSFLRRRQAQIAQLFIDDQPYQANMIEKIAAPNSAIPEATIWEQPQMDQRKLVLTTMPENEIPRDRQVFRPSPWSLLVMRSLGRYLQRNNESAHVSLTRISKEPIPPRVLLEKESPPEMEPLRSSYGRLPK